MKRIYKLNGKVVSLDEIMDKVRDVLENSGYNYLEDLGVDFEDFDEVQQLSIEELFLEVGCPQDMIFDKNGKFTEYALINYYDKAMNFYDIMYDKSEDDFDKLCRDCHCFEEED